MLTPFPSIPFGRRLPGVGQPTVPTAPTAPTYFFNPTTRVLSFAGSGPLELKYLDGPWGPYATVQVDDLIHLADTWQARVQASGTTPASAPTGSPFIDAKVVVTPPVTTGSTFKITATVSGTPTNATLTKAGLKYNKRFGLCITSDDGGKSDETVVEEVLLGGVAANGKSYSGVSFSDGAGKPVFAGHTFAITTKVNGTNGRDTEDNPQITSWAQFDRMFKRHRGFGASSHSENHGPFNSIAEATADLQRAQVTFESKLGFRPRTMTTPGGFNYYTGATFELAEMLWNTSEGFGGDGSPNAAPYQSEVQYGDRVRLPRATNPQRLISNRRFLPHLMNWNSADQLSWYDNQVTYAQQQFNAGERVVFSIGDHGPGAGQADNFEAFLRYALNHPTNSDGQGLGIYNLQEVAEYEEVKRLCPISAPVVSGNTVTWTIDRSALPSYSRYHDLSVVVSGVTLTNVVVEGADEFSYNASTGLINLLKLNAPTPPPTLPTPGVDADPFFALWDSGTRQSGELLYTGKDVYAVNNVRDDDSDSNWTDNDLRKTYGGEMRLKNNDDKTTYRIDTRKYRFNLNKIRVFSRDWNSKITWYYIARGSFEKTLLGEIQPNQGWVEFTLPQDTPVTWIVAVCDAFFDEPSEVELFGTWITPLTPTAPVRRSKPFKQMLGANSFPWNTLKSDDPSLLSPVLMGLQRMFGRTRGYHDRFRVEPIEGQYMLGPGWHEAGSFNTDTWLAGLKSQGQEVLLVLKNAPGWIQETWPADMRTTEQMTVKWQGSWAATLAYAETPEAHKHGALLVGQVTMRYGRVVVDESRIKVYQAPGGGFPTNKKRTGLDLLNWIEINNESDSDWRGRQGYMNGRMRAARASAYYDGHKGTLGPDAGIVNIDPTMRLALDGSATATTEFLQGILDWCREHRGYKANGKVDLPFHAIKYHAYATDIGITQSGTITRGRAPEPAQYAAKYQEFADFVAEKMDPELLLFIGEFGYDLGQSTQRAARPMDVAAAVNNVIPLATLENNQADWMGRTALEMDRVGLDGLEMYMMEDASTPPSLHTRYSYCGIINADKTRRMAGNMYYQLNQLLGEMVYESTESLEPRVTIYKHPVTGVRAKVGWVPKEEGATATYTSTVPASLKYRLSQTTTTPTITEVPAGSYAWQLTEKPQLLFLTSAPVPYVATPPEASLNQNNGYLPAGYSADKLVGPAFA